MNHAADPQRAATLLAALDVYRPARQVFLAAVGLPASNREPFAEFSEHLVQALMGGKLATLAVQAGYDLVLVDGRKVQVRSLANSGAQWVNEHLVYRIPGVELYALVVFEAFAVVGVLVFPTDDLTAICAALGKHHPHQDETLQFTHSNFAAIRDDPARFTRLGMQVWLPPLDLPA